MYPRRVFLSFLILLLGLLGSPLNAQQKFFWPTPSKAFDQGLGGESFLQATASGNPESGGFGCVRNNGWRFHEGMDIAPVLPRKKGEATDPIFAIQDGRVAFISSKPGTSSYGRYIIIVHDGAEPDYHSLYAHLASIQPGLQVGDRVRAGEQIAIMGRSAASTIPRERAHLHLEIGFRLSDNFQSWYTAQKYGSPNLHGLYNGMNLVGLDPLDFYRKNRAGQAPSVAAYLKKEPPGAVLVVSTRRTPDFVKRYPWFLARPESVDTVAWELTLTAYGLPLKFVPLSRSEEPNPGKPGTVRVTAFDAGELDHWKCRALVKVGKGGKPVLSESGRKLIDLIFAFK